TPAGAASSAPTPIADEYVARQAQQAAPLGRDLQIGRQRIRVFAVRIRGRSPARRIAPGGVRKYPRPAGSLLLERSRVFYTRSMKQSFNFKAGAVFTLTFLAICLIVWIIGTDPFAAPEPASYTNPSIPLDAQIITPVHPGPPVPVTAPF